MPPDDERFGAHLEVWNDGAVDRLASILASDYAGHVRGGTPAERDAAELGSAITAFRSRFPAVRFEVVEQVVDGDHVASRLVASRDDRELATGTNFSRWRDTRLAEEWVLWEPFP